MEMIWLSDKQEDAALVSPAHGASRAEPQKRVWCVKQFEQRLERKKRAKFIFFLRSRSKRLGRQVVKAVLHLLTRFGAGEEEDWRLTIFIREAVLTVESIAAHANIDASGR